MQTGFCKAGFSKDGVVALVDHAVVAVAGIGLVMKIKRGSAIFGQVMDLQKQRVAYALQALNNFGKLPVFGKGRVVDVEQVARAAAAEVPVDGTVDVRGDLVRGLICSRGACIPEARYGENGHRKRRRRFFTA